jgi:hypothetical protein
VTARTADLIALLSTNLRPVVPVPIPSVRFRWWGVVGGTALFAAIAMGVRRDWPSAIAAWPVVGHTIVLTLVAGSGAWAALRLATPGESRPRAAAWPVVLVLLWLAWLGTELALSSSSNTAWLVGFGWRCIVRAAVGAAVPGAVLLLMVRRAMPLFTGPAAVALAASTAAVGGVAAEWMCPNTWAMHLLAWHAVPVIVVVVAAAGFADALVYEVARRPTRSQSRR